MKKLQYIEKSKTTLKVACRVKTNTACTSTLNSPSTAHSKHLKKQDRNFTSLAALIFLPDLMFFYLIFYLHNFLIALIN